MSARRKTAARFKGAKPEPKRRRYVLIDLKRSDRGLHMTSLSHPKKPVEERGMEIERAERLKASIESPDRVWGRTRLEPESVEIVPAWEYFGYPDPEAPETD